MFYPDVPVEKWKKRWGLKTWTQNCGECKSPQSPNRPFITKDYAGLELENCTECGVRIRLYSSVPASEQNIKAWNETMEGLL